MFSQPLVGLTNIYAALLTRRELVGAPTTMVLPLTATEKPEFVRLLPSDVVNSACCIQGSIVTGYRAPLSLTRSKSCSPRKSTQAGNGCPSASVAVNPEYRRLPRPPSVKPVPLWSTLASKFPERVNAIVSGCPFALPGGWSRVKPCSIPTGPFTYHSVKGPRRYSTRFWFPCGATAVTTLRCSP